MISLVLVAGLFCARPVLAQGSAGGDVTIIHTNPDNSTYDEGIFTVLATQDSTNQFLWHVTVDWKQDLVTQGAFLDGVNVRFLSNGNRQNIASLSGGVVDTTQYDQAILSKTAMFSDPNSPAGAGPPDGAIRDGHEFSANVLLNSGSTPIDQVYFNLYNSGAGTGTFAVVTPEGASLALMLPGIVPLVVVLRRRRSSPT